MGAVIIAYFGAMCIIGSENASRYATWQLIFVGVLLIIPNLIGAVAAFFYFIRGNDNKIYPCMIYVASIWTMFRITYSNYRLIVNTSQYLSMNTTISLILKIVIYGLIIYQTHTLWIKRKNTNEISDEIISRNPE